MAKKRCRFNITVFKQSWQLQKCKRSKMGERKLYTPFIIHHIQLVTERREYTGVCSINIKYQQRRTKSSLLHMYLVIS
jgi:hypothetical protein